MLAGRLAAVNVRCAAITRQRRLCHARGEGGARGEPRCKHDYGRL